MRYYYRKYRVGRSRGENLGDKKVYIGKESEISEGRFARLSRMYDYTKHSESPDDKKDILVYIG